MLQVIQVICVLPPLSIGLPSITSKKLRIFRLNMGKLCWRAKFSSTKANPEALQLISACDHITVFWSRSEHLTMR